MIFHCGFPNHSDLFCQVGLLTGSIFIRDCAVRTSKSIDIIKINHTVTDSCRQFRAVRDGDKPYPALVEHLYLYVSIYLSIY